MPPEPTRRYHHGDLRGALMRAAWKLIAADGVQNFSLAAAARETGVSPRAPYRHFPDREALLTALAAQAAVALTRWLEGAISEHDDTPAEQLAAAAGAYVLFAQERPAQFDVLYRAGLDKSTDDDLAAARRETSDTLLPLTIAATAGRESAADLLESTWCLMHGYAALLRDGFFRDREPDDPRHPAQRAREAVRVLARAYA